MNQELMLLKRKVYDACSELVSERITSLQQSLKGFQDAANEETKSSAGDKYETGRAMMHLEKEKVAHALNEVLKQQKVLGQLIVSKAHDQAALGALIITDSGNFYLSASLGKLKVDDTDVFCLSPVAPLGNAFLGKKKGDHVTFKKMSYTIESIC